jgi:hypothetical protein
VPAEQLARVHDDLRKLDVGIATLLTRQESVLERLERIDARSEAFVPRAEIEKDHLAITARIVSLEEDRRKIVWSLIGTIGAGVSFAAHTLWQLAAHAPVPR